MLFLLENGALSSRQCPIGYFTANLPREEAEETKDNRQVTMFHCSQLHYTVNRLGCLPSQGRSGRYFYGESGMFLYLYTLLLVNSYRL